jgi:hypothetical protein
MNLKQVLLTAVVGSLLVVSGYALRGLGIGQANLISNANAQEPGRRCSLKTLKGAYGIKFEGEKIGTGKFVSVSRVTFDGNGSFTTNETGRFNGDLIQRTFTGPYVVNDDCTGFLDFTSHITTPPHAAHGDFVIVNNGQEFFVVDNEEGWAANGVGKRIN